MNILIISGNPIFSLGLRSTILERFEQAHFFEEGSLSVASIATTKHHFDLMVLDAVSVQNSKVVKHIKNIREQHPHLPILVDLGDQLADSHFYIRLGANALVSNSATLAEIVEAVEALSKGANKKFVSQDIAQLLLSQLTGNAAASVLTPREKILANLLISSKPRAEIAQIAGTRPNTITAYKRNIFEKLGIKTVSELTRKLQPAVIPVSPK